jgi:hypothetical protein
MEVSGCCRGWQARQTHHARTVVAAGLAALVGAYPIATPHIWLALAMLGGMRFIQQSPAGPALPAAELDSAL